MSTLGRSRSRCILSNSQEYMPSVTFENLSWPQKAAKEQQSDVVFHNFRRQLFHSSLSLILRMLKPAMEKPKVVLFGDGHYQRTIYGLGPYIADYEEQVLLSCIVRGWCARYVSSLSSLWRILLSMNWIDVRPHPMTLIKVVSCPIVHVNLTQHS